MLKHLSNKYISSNNSYLQHICAILIIFILALFTLKCFYPIYHITQDSPFHLNRLNELMCALKNNSYPWYISYDGLNGYGYFLKAFYCDITLIPFAIVGLITDKYIAFYTLLFCIMILAGTFMYIAMRKMNAGWAAAVLAAILFGFSSYYRIHIFTAVAEPFGFAFLPLAFWGFYEIILGNYKKWYILSFSYSLILFTHVLTSVLFATLLFFLCILYIKVFIKDYKRFTALIYASIATVFLSAIFLFPFLEQYLGNEYYFQTTNVIMPELQGVYGPSKLLELLFSAVLPLKTEYDIIIGIILIFPLIFRFFIKQKKVLITLSDILVIIGIFLACMTLKGVIWNFFPFNLLNVLQFVRRIFGLSNFCFSIACAIYVSSVVKEFSLNKWRQLGIIIFFILITMVLINAEGFQYTELKNRSHPLEYEINTKLSTYVGNEYVPAKVPSIHYLLEAEPPMPKAKCNNTIISNYANNRGIISFCIDSRNCEVVEMPLLYYKGYSFETSAGQKLPVEQSKNGLIELRIGKPLDSEKIIGSYTGTFIQKASIVVSVLSFLVLFCIIFRLPGRCFGKKLKSEAK